MKYEVVYETRKQGAIGIWSPTKVIVDTDPRAGMISILQNAREQLYQMGLEVRSHIGVRNMEEGS